MIAPGCRDRSRHGLAAVLADHPGQEQPGVPDDALAGGRDPLARSDLAAMRRLGVPVVLVATLLFMERYLHVLGDELGRMTDRPPCPFVSARGTSSPGRCSRA